MNNLIKLIIKNFIAVLLSIPSSFFISAGITKAIYYFTNGSVAPCRDTGIIRYKIIDGQRDSIIGAPQGYCDLGGYLHFIWPILLVTFIVSYLVIRKLSDKVWR